MRNLGQLQAILKDVSVSNIKLTVFTPTYNRVKTLPKLYQSLCEQICDGFEWLIVDDGSDDETQDLVKNFIAENRIKINYVKQENGGKHTAINCGLNLARGYLFMILDSDDYLASEKVVSKIIENIPFLEFNPHFCGIVGNRIFECGKTIGTIFNNDILDTDFIEYRDTYKIIGDRAEVIKTSVMKEFPFPVVEGEKFCPEGLVWNRMAQKYKARYINEPYIVCEYLTGGLSDGVKHFRKQSSVAFMNYYSEYLRYNVTYRLKVKAAISYWAVHFKGDKNIVKGIQEVGAYSFFMPIGWVLNKIGRL